MTAAAQPTGEPMTEEDIIRMLGEQVKWHEEQGRPYSAGVDRDAIALIECLRSALPQQGAGEGGEVARPQTASAPQVQDVAISPELVEMLQEATPGPYGFQVYGKRERLVTMAVGEGRGEPFAIFNRAEDARAFAAAVTAVQKAIAGDPRGKAASPPSALLRDETIEECAKIADEFDYAHKSSIAARIALAIRSLSPLLSGGGSSDSSISEDGNAPSPDATNGSASCRTTS